MTGEGMTESEIAAQNAIDAAGGIAARIHWKAVDRLPRWRRWLIRYLSPPYPCVRAQLPPGRILLTKPLDAPPGVAIIGAVTDWEPLAVDKAERDGSGLR